MGNEGRRLEFDVKGNLDRVWDGDTATWDKNLPPANTAGVLVGVGPIWIRTTVRYELDQKIQDAYSECMAVYGGYRVESVNGKWEDTAEFFDPLDGQGFIYPMGNNIPLEVGFEVVNCTTTTRSLWYFRGCDTSSSSAGELCPVQDSSSSSYAENCIAWDKYINDTLANEDPDKRDEDVCA